MKTIAIRPVVRDADVDLKKLTDAIFASCPEGIQELDIKVMGDKEWTVNKNPNFKPEAKAASSSTKSSSTKSDAKSSKAKSEADEVLAAAGEVVETADVSTEVADASAETLESTDVDDLLADLG